MFHCASITHSRLHAAVGQRYFRTIFPRIKQRAPFCFDVAMEWQDMQTRLWVFLSTCFTAWELCVLRLHLSVSHTKATFLHTWLQKIDLLQGEIKWTAILCELGELISDIQCCLWRAALRLISLYYKKYPWSPTNWVTFRLWWTVKVVGTETFPWWTSAESLFSLLWSMY